MIFYVTCRPLRYRKEIISPKECLKNNFTGLNFKFQCLAINRKIDGRWLYEIEIDDKYSDTEKEEIKKVFLEGLAAFSVHEKTLESTKELAEKLNGCKYEINKNKISIIEEEK